MGFLFVDSIERIESGKRARGRFKTLAGMAMPPSLIAEAIGQLAGWIAMERCDFSARPVAGIVGECVIESPETSGDELELEVEAGTCDSEAIEYRGSAATDGRRIVALSECIGPMLPMEEFDDPGRVAKRFEALRSGKGKGELTSDLLGAIPFEPIETKERGVAYAILEAPKSSLIYAEHFPRKPVLPGTLLLDAEMRLGLSLVGREAAGKEIDRGRGRVSLRGIKFRTFISPGATLELEARLLGSNAKQRVIALGANQRGKRIAGASMEIEL
jgi:3-hydroxymyristoyl/3-hydroxydecanoyl-(acyl carrier protein) dehydratase